MDYGYIRTSVASIDPETQAKQLRDAGVDASNTYRDLAVSGRNGATSRDGWHALNARLAEGDTPLVASIDRIGRRWLDTVTAVLDLQRRGIRLRSLAETEAQWARYLDAAPDSPEAFIGSILAQFAAWTAHQEVESISRRTRAGLEKARAQGKKLGRPPALTVEQISAASYLRATGISDRAIARTLGVAASTVKPESTDGRREGWQIGMREPTREKALAPLGPM